MRKRSQYKRANKIKTHIPTLIIMIVVLLCIVFFGQTFSDGVAGFVSPAVPVKEEAQVAVSDHPLVEPAADARPMAPQSGTVISQAFKNAAQQLIPLLAQRP